MIAIGAIFLLSPCLLASCATLSVPKGEDMIAFAGRNWAVIDTAIPIGPGPNRFSRANVGLDREGNLVLSTRKDAEGWTAAEIFLDESLSYGTYELEILPVEGGLDPRTVFGFYTWDEDPEFAHREIDIELARWGIPEAPLLNFGVQPTEGRPGRVFSTGIDLSAPFILGFEWRPDSLRFFARSKSGRVEWSFPPPDVAGGSAGGAGAVSGAKAPGGSEVDPGFTVPPSGRERLSLNLWLFRGSSPSSADSIRIASFRYSP